MKISIAIPVYDMPNKDFFLKRCLESIKCQTYRDFEIMISENGQGMPQNTNEAIRKCTGDYIKVLFMDDYLAHVDALAKIVQEIRKDESAPHWIVTACAHDPGTHIHYPSYTEEMVSGKNTIGSPSVLTIKNGLDIFFDEKLSWLLDCDLYKRLYDTYGPPRILNDINVAIGLHPGQTTHLMADEQKQKEYTYLQNKYKK